MDGQCACARARTSSTRIVSSSGRHGRREGKVLAMGLEDVDLNSRDGEKGEARGGRWWLGEIELARVKVESS